MPDPPADLREEQDEDYDENADEDFDPTHDHDDDGDESNSSSDDAAPRHPSTSQKPPKQTSNPSPPPDLDSGDEVTIQHHARKRRKRAQNDADDSGGEASFVRTRAQRQAEQHDRQQRRVASSADVTINVDQLWAELSRVPVGRVALLPRVTNTESKNVDDEHPPNPSDTITIKRQIEFAGQVTEIEEKVPRSSKEAQRYLAAHPEADRADDASSAANAAGLQRPLRRPSMFEPNPTGAVRGVPPDKLRPRAPSRVDVLLAEKRLAEEQRKKAEKMTTVQKSALDWKGFVDQEGFRDELDVYGKSKQGFLAREAFLDRAAGMREQAARDARLKG